MPSRIDHILLAAGIAPALLRSPAQRNLLHRMRRFTAELPGVLDQPLPEVHEIVSPSFGSEPGPEDQTRRLADLAALLARRSPLGLCLRRSLVRYRFLRVAGVPVGVCFGARLDARGPNRSIHGHAWTVLGGEPYHERPTDVDGFTVMLTWPESAD